MPFRIGSSFASIRKYLSGTELNCPFWIAMLEPKSFGSEDSNKFLEFMEYPKEFLESPNSSSQIPISGIGISLSSSISPKIYFSSFGLNNGKYWAFLLDLVLTTNEFLNFSDFEEVRVSSLWGSRGWKKYFVIL